MKVLAIIHGFHPLRGGAETAALEIASRARREGVETIVLTARMGSSPPEEEVRGVRVIRTRLLPRGLGPAGPGAMLAFAASALRRGHHFADEVDLVHAHFTLPAGLIALALLRTRGRPYLVTLPGSDVPGYSERPFSRLYSLTTPLVRRVWRGASRVVAVSEDLRRCALRIDPTARIEIIPSGVDTARHASADGVGREPGRILLVGRLIPLKGQAVFLRALARVQERYRGPLFAEIVGAGPDLEHLRSEAARLGLSPVVSIPGFVSDDALAAQFARASLFVMPSLNDAGPLAVLEAMAAGLPVVASRVGGIPEALAGVDALLVPPGDEVALAEAIIAVLSDPGRARNMARECRTKALTLDWDRITSRYVSVYEELVPPYPEVMSGAGGDGPEPTEGGSC
jgi:glycosyltransferase involved in cell wall biosynthesis